MKVLKEARFSVATLKGPVCGVKCGDARIHAHIRFRAMNRIAVP